MSRIYDALKRAAEQAKRRHEPAAPPGAEGVTAPRPAETTAPPPSPAPPPPASAPEPSPLLAGIRADVADRVRVETWLRIEEAALQELAVGRLPRCGGASAWLLEALGGVAFGALVASVSLFTVFFVFVWLMHIRLPQLFW